MSILMGFDLFFEFFCARFPLLFYLIAGALGALIGKKLSGGLRAKAALKKRFEAWRSPAA
jgi:hypothetical protein